MRRQNTCARASADISKTFETGGSSLSGATHEARGRGIRRCENPQVSVRHSPGHDDVMSNKAPICHSVLSGKRDTPNIVYIHQVHWVIRSELVDGG